MSFLDRLARCRSKDMSAYRPFIVAGGSLGWVKNDFAAALRDFPDVFTVTDAAVSLSDRLQDFQDRTAAVDGAVRRLRERGLVRHWFEEKFPVKRAHGAVPLFDMERGAISFFGLPAFGVHLNGYVGHGNKMGAEMKLWVAERSHEKPVEPGKYDQIVAGGQPANLTVMENLIKECGEEASIDPALASQAVPVGAITYTMEMPEGLRRDVLYNFDLALAPDFNPVNTDGEVHAFHLWPLDKVSAIVHDTDDFKFNCSLVAIDFLIRHGAIAPEHPEYIDCIKGLRT